MRSDFLKVAEKNGAEEDGIMKKKGIINPDLAYALADLGHMDSFVICDMGFPIPKDAKRIDLSVVAGMPEFLPVLKACLNEVAVQEMVLMEGVVSSNEYLHDQILHMVHNHEVGYLSFADFREKVKDAKFFIRTGEKRPCSNIFMVTSSGAEERVAKYDISFI